mgnify:CR=1 FL=1
MVIKNSFFKVNPKAVEVKVTLESYNLDTNVYSGSATMKFKLNKPPFNGTCIPEITNGIALETYYVIKCSDWIDTDSLIVRYGYYCINLT